MKIFHIKIPSPLDILKSLCGIFLSFFKGKTSMVEDVNEPIKIKVDNGLGKSNDNAASLQSWTEWDDESQTQPTPADEEIDLFKDMEPDFKKPAMVVIKPKQHPNMAAMNNAVYNNKTTSLGHYDSTNSVGVELGTWDDSPSAWEDETLDDSLIDAETSRMMKDMKRQEREQRAIEQQRRREAREMQKQMKKQHPSLLGVKLS